MKTKKQLEKEIEKLKVKRKKYNDRGMFNQDRDLIDKEIKPLEATLTQTNEIIKLIEERLDYYDNQPMTSEFSKGFQHSCNMFRKELLTKIKGDYE